MTGGRFQVRAAVVMGVFILENGPLAKPGLTLA